jgi:Mimiviridae putative ATP-dependent RNA helicase
MMPGFFQWAARHGCRRIPPMPGIRWAIGAAEQKQKMAAIRSQIIPARGVRLTTDSIPDFPACSITAELYDIDEPATMERLYSDMEHALGVLENKMVTDVDAEHPLTRVLRARQRIELLKVPIAVELATDALEKGLSVGIFVNFSQTIDELSARLGCKDIIDGRPENVRRRQSVIDSYQRDETRLVILNSDAGGISVSLQDLRGEFPRLGIVFPGFSATTFRQLCGRFPRDGAKSKSHYRVILAAEVKSETQIHRNLRGKLDNLAALNDADFAPDNLPLTRMGKWSTII